MSTLPTVENTPLDTIAPTVERLRKSFHARKTQPLEYRKQQLRKLWWAIKDNEQLIVDAVWADMRKPKLEALSAEVIWILNDIISACDSLDEWAKEEPQKVEINGKFSNLVIRKEPMGVILDIGAWNFPFQLLLCPLIGAIAAGNTAVIKPSEVSANSAAVVTKIIAESLDPDCYAVVNGAIPETTELLKQKWDKIAYTGNGAVARIVAKAAAPNLTPTLLELGGINPCLLTKKANVKLAARRAAWGKCMNAGQVCLSPDYAIVPSALEDSFVAAWKETMQEFFPNGAKDSGHLSRIVNDRHFNRVKKMLDDSKGTVVHGGTMDASDRFIDMTLIKVPNEDDPLLKDEIFGPLFPYLVVDDLDEQLAIINRVSDTPLALYAFTDDKQEQEKILRNTRSGGATINDSIWHAAFNNISFGGVGESGQGSYRGKSSFDAFSHRRTCANQPAWIERVLTVRYPPFTQQKLDMFRRFTEKKPSFDRDGKVSVGWVGWALTLGGGSGKNVVAKYVMAIIGIVASLCCL